MDAYLTFSAAQAAEAAAILAASVVIPMHVDGWQHLTQDAALVPEAFARRGLADRLVVLKPGETIEIVVGATATSELDTSMAESVPRDLRRPKKAGAGSRDR